MRSTDEVATKPTLVNLEKDKSDIVDIEEFIISVVVTTVEVTTAEVTTVSGEQK
jgi:hypothetical protein